MLAKSTTTLRRWYLPCRGGQLKAFANFSYAQHGFDEEQARPRRVFAVVRPCGLTVGVMASNSRNDKAPNVRNQRGVAKHWPAVNHRVDPDLKAIIERTATRMDCSQAVALNLILDHIDLTLDGVPTWVEQEQPAKEAFQLDNIA